MEPGSPSVAPAKRAEAAPHLAEVLQALPGRRDPQGQPARLAQQDLAGRAQRDLLVQRVQPVQPGLLVPPDPREIPDQPDPPDLQGRPDHQ
jgi:hypothetical protein